MQLEPRRFLDRDEIEHVTDVRVVLISSSISRKIKRISAFPKMFNKHLLSIAEMWESFKSLLSCCLTFIQLISKQKT